MAFACIYQPNNYDKVFRITYRTKLKLDKEVGGGDLAHLCTITYLLAYLSCLNPKFRKLYRLAAHDTPISKKLLKLQLGAISISDMVKRRVPLLDSQPLLEGSGLDMFLGQKWSISNLWERFLVWETWKPFCWISY